MNDSLSLPSPTSKTEDEITRALNRLEEYCFYERRLNYSNTKTIVSTARAMFRKYGVFEPSKSTAIKIESDCRERGLTPETIKQRLYTIECIAGSMGIELKLRKPRKVHRRVRYLTRTEARRLIAGACNNRDRAIIMTLLYTGIRSKELINIDVNDVDLENRTIYVHDPEIGGKNHYERDVAIPEKLIESLQAWLNERPDHESKALFVTQDGRRLIRDRLYNIVKDAGKRARIDQPVSPHLLRHTLATSMCESNLNITIVQRQLGHRDIKSTLIYAHVDTSMVRKVMNESFEY
ncbi:tyrosine-type recombinase/integrase [Methanocella sp. MCL-LM]|uniref:tyrosine-type recombinase/integrase n=1 Tax=Methanocella sp. MCL-LM TaxID=3412035 RepID=UPI003C724408